MTAKQKQTVKTAYQHCDDNEIKIIALLIKGHTNKTIASKLKKTTRSIENDVFELTRYFKAKNRVDLALKLVASGAVEYK